MDLLDDRQLAPFRKEYLEREREIQRYIGVYLSGVVIVCSWLVGPQTKPLDEMALGNNGYNIYAFLVISVVNALFITFLIYKSLDVHDTTQFVTVYAKPGSIYTRWEKWRRGKYSITKPVRTLYFVALALLPTVMALLLLVFAGSKLFTSEESLKDQLVQIENNRSATRVASANLPTPSPSPMPDQPADVGDQLARTEAVFGVARILFLLVCALHLMPLLFFYRNAGPTQQQWEVVAELKEAQRRGIPPDSFEALGLQAFLEDRVVVHKSEGKTEINNGEANESSEKKEN
jgi:hypothetical protein